ncbi:hypothetical protein [Pelosinus propionicus]|uniref:Uncharacterized protein n=1 Tax=Pelosinus propionicus DSM 13327 TaxID=1123291 RepID=A0A1I4PTT4_9FIRM|nr:hypothetical protein [Pelosinus propionicus]SFM30785.1 hypothetical protein SAMN04490355_10723 [Pelosinus propionicus DSM 13327]
MEIEKQENENNLLDDVNNEVKTENMKLDKPKKQKKVCELDTLENLQKKKSDLQDRQNEIAGEIKAVNAAIRKVEQINKMSADEMREFILKEMKKKG